MQFKLNFILIIHSFFPGFLVLTLNNLINKIYKHFMFYMIQMSYIFILNDPEASVEH